MAQFIAFNEAVEVNKPTVLSVINSMENGKDTRSEILSKCGIDLNANDWFPQQAWLDAFQEIARSLGSMNLFLIGKAIIDNAQFPPINGLEEGLRSIDVAYHLNHRIDEKIMFNSKTGRMTEGIGHYALTEWDEVNRKAVMVCDNPYPSKFDEGIITQVVRRFKPKGAKEDITRDTTKETRIGGGESCTYLISW